MTQITEANDFDLSVQYASIAQNIPGAEKEFLKLEESTPGRQSFSRKSVVRVKNIQRKQQQAPVKDADKNHLEVLSYLAEENNNMKEKISVYLKEINQFKY